MNEHFHGKQRRLVRLLVIITFLSPKSVDNINQGGPAPVAVLNTFYTNQIYGHIQRSNTLPVQTKYTELIAEVYITYSESKYLTLVLIFCLKINILTRPVWNKTCNVWKAACTIRTSRISLIGETNSTRYWPWQVGWYWWFYQYGIIPFLKHGKSKTPEGLFRKRLTFRFI